MNTNTTIHPNGIDKVSVEDASGVGYRCVQISVRGEKSGYHTLSVFCETESDVAIIMAAMAKAVRGYYADAEPEPDWEAIAAEMDSDLYRETVRGI